MIFVDTSALISLFIDSDDAHSRVKEIFHANADEDFIASNEIFSETLNWLARKVGMKFATKVGSILLDGFVINFIDCIAEDRVAALEYLHKYSDQKLSFTDCLSFAVINRLKIKKIFSLDSDFRILKHTQNLI